MSALGRRGAEEGMASKRAILLIARNLLILSFNRHVVQIVVLN